MTTFLDIDLDLNLSNKKRDTLSRRVGGSVNCGGWNRYWKSVDQYIRKTVTPEGLVQYEKILEEKRECPIKRNVHIIAY